MLKSLFGELVPTPLRPGGPMPEFAATAVLESTDTRVDDDGRMLDRHQQDLFFSGSPATAMREHMAQARMAEDVRTITLLDPTRQHDCVHLLTLLIDGDGAAACTLTRLEP